MRWPVPECKSCTEKVILNCFTHCLKQTAANYDNVEKTVNGETLQSMEQDATKCGVQFTRLGLTDLLNPSDENNVNKKVTREELLEETARAPDENDAGLDNDHTEELETEDTYSIDAQLKSLAIAKATLERHNTLNEACLQVFSACQCESRLKKQAKLKQKSIYNYLVKK